MSDQTFNIWREIELASGNSNPEWGKEYEFSHNGFVFNKYIFIAMNPKRPTEYLALLTPTFIVSFKYCRQIKTLRDAIADIIITDDPLHIMMEKIMNVINEKGGSK